MIERKILIDENGKPVAVQIDYDTFKKIEEILEDYALAKMIEEVKDDESLDLKSAKEEYEKECGK